jgi:hypothetical protein
MVIIEAGNVQVGDLRVCKRTFNGEARYEAWEVKAVERGTGPLEGRVLFSYDECGAQSSHSLESGLSFVKNIDDLPSAKQFAPKKRARTTFKSRADSARGMGINPTEKHFSAHVAPTPDIDIGAVIAAALEEVL